MTEAGYSDAGAAAIKDEVTFYENLRSQVKLHSGDAIDLKLYEPAMRHLIDTYIRAEDSVKVSEFDDLSLVQLIVERGVGAVEALPPSIRKKEKAVAETIENNVRKLIIDESPINPKYYEKMSELLDALIAQRKEGALAYQEYLAKVIELTRRPRPARARGDTRRPEVQGAARCSTTSAATRPWRSASTRRCAPACRTTGAATP
jgi:type I restriction enzyme R subunit